ncbi:MAG: putative phage protein [Anaerocolumna sp.]|jgi:hypothetical protein|nr:putative phage protein [Anaerocolumna sp.]
MIGGLPKQLEVDEVMYDIRTDYRNCLLILEAFNDPDNLLDDAYEIMLKVLYKQLPSNTNEAIEKALWFLNCGGKYEKNPKTEKPVYDWNKDEQMIFSALNNVAGQEIRSVAYMHYWTFLGLFQGIGEGFFTTVISIRHKLNIGKKLDKSEEEFFKQHKDLVTLKPKRSQEEQTRIDYINQMFS